MSNKILNTAIAFNSILILSSCGVSGQIHEEALTVINENQPTIEKLAKNAHGVTTSISDIKYEPIFNNGKYTLPDVINTTIKTNYKFGTLTYDINTQTVYDDLYTKEIQDSFINKLPYSKSKIERTYFLDNNRKYPKFKSGTRSYQEVIFDNSKASGDSYTLLLLTLEDLNEYYNSLDNIEIHNTLDNMEYGKINYLIMSMNSKIQLNNLYSDILSKDSDILNTITTESISNLADVLENYKVSSYITNLNDNSYKYHELRKD